MFHLINIPAGYCGSTSSHSPASSGLQRPSVRSIMAFIMLSASSFAQDIERRISSVNSLSVIAAFDFDIRLSIAP